MGKVWRAVTVESGTSDKHTGRWARQAAKQAERRPSACIFTAVCVFAGVWVDKVCRVVTVEGGRSDKHTGRWTRQAAM